MNNASYLCIVATGKNIKTLASKPFSWQFIQLFICILALGCPDVLLSRVMLHAACLTVMECGSKSYFHKLDMYFKQHWKHARSSGGELQAMYCTVHTGKQAQVVLIIVFSRFVFFSSFKLTQFIVQNNRIIVFQSKFPLSVTNYTAIKFDQASFVFSTVC